MRKLLVILISIIITALNINSYGELNVEELQRAKLLTEPHKEIVIEESINWSIGSTLFKLIHFTELMFISEIGRKKIIV